MIYYPNIYMADRGYDTIICNYVICILPPGERLDVLETIQCLLKKNGTAYISVNNQRPKQGWGITKRGTCQYKVGDLPLEKVHRCSQFVIYKVTKDSNLDFRLFVPSRPLIVD